MIRSTLSILGLYNARPDIFDTFNLPDGVDKDVLEPELLAECAEFEVLYTDPDTIKLIIGAWSARRLYTWTTLLKTTQFEYNPIWNYDGTETETITRELSGDDLETRNLKNTTNSSSSGTDNSLLSKYGFNSNAPAPAEVNEGNSTGTAAGTGTDTGTVAGERSETETITTERTRGGNQGTTTTQAMIQEERQIADFDIYQYIITDFKQRFCIMVY